MKRPLQLSLAIALALSATDVLALGLGPVRVHSRLNQPLDAEIPILQASPGEAEGLLVSLAAADDFERIGLSRSQLRVPLKFKLDKDASGAPVIKVTSDEPVRDTYLDFLVEANWPKGRLLREYTVLLDPPVTAPARVAATPAGPAIKPAAKPAPKPVAQQPEKPAAATAAPAPAPAAAVATSPLPEPAPTAPVASADQYGPVAVGETLSGIARSVRPGEDLNRVMLALLKSNPEAFFRDNVNALKRGAILRVPDASEIRAIGTAAEAAAQVRAQVEDWRGSAAGSARVAEAGRGQEASSRETSRGSRAAPSERLELVPPSSAREVAGGERPGAGAGEGGGDRAAAATSELRDELARVREALTSREQEGADLRSRVKELEGIQTKNDRLIALKDSEIAELQKRLRELEAAAAASTVAAVTPAVTQVETSASAEAAVASPPTAKAPITAPTTTAPEIAAPAEPAPAAQVGAAETGAGNEEIWGTGSTPAGEAAESVTSGETAVAPEAAGAAASEPAPSGETETGTMTEPTASEPSAPSEPAAPTAAEPPAASASAPVATTEGGPIEAPAPAAGYPAWMKFGAIGAGILVLLAGWLGLRRKKPAPVKRESLASAFGDSPLGGSEAAADDDEADLLVRIEENPHDAGLYLELLSVYYARRDAASFERMAERMHETVAEESETEWAEVQAMGQELAPRNPLFAADQGAASVESAPSHEGHFEPAKPTDETESHEGLGFGLGELEAAPTSGFGEGVQATEETAVDFGDLPPIDAGHLAPETSVGTEHLEYETALLADLEREPAVAESAAPETPAAADHFEADLLASDDFLSGSDAVATKLDLARAYMDMGDPDGARSMLEEVLSEGDVEQQKEARRLIGELS